MVVHRTRRVGTHPWTRPPPQTKVTIAGKNKIDQRENLVRPFLVHKLLGSRPPPPSTTSLLCLYVQASPRVPFRNEAGEYGPCAQSCSAVSNCGLEGKMYGI